MELIATIENENFYNTRHWDREVATRYVIEVEHGVVEASHFRHYKGEEFVKDVIELPTSYGCPIGCRHCASALMDNTRLLEMDDFIAITKNIANDNEIETDDSFLVTYSGIGESAIKPDRIVDASYALYDMYPQTYYTFTTVGLDPSYINRIDNLSKYLPVHYLQITFLSYKSSVLSSLIPTYKQLDYDFNGIISQIRDVDNISVRLNVVLIKGYNDGIKDWEYIADELEGLEDRIIWRISELNETDASIKHGLSSTPEETLFSIRDLLVESGFEAYVFMSDEDDKLNCGQLAWENYSYKR